VYAGALFPTAACTGSASGPHRLSSTWHVLTYDAAGGGLYHRVELDPRPTGLRPRLPDGSSSGGSAAAAAGNVVEPASAYYVLGTRDPFSRRTRKACECHAVVGAKIGVRLCASRRRIPWLRSLRSIRPRPISSD